MNDFLYHCPAPSRSLFAGQEQGCQMGFFLFIFKGFLYLVFIILLNLLNETKMQKKMLKKKLCHNIFLYFTVWKGGEGARRVIRGHKGFTIPINPKTFKNKLLYQYYSVHKYCRAKRAFKVYFYVKYSFR